MAGDPERIPVIVGVGQVNDRPADPFAGLDSAGLMAAALREAEKDAGGSWLADLDSLAVVDQISFRELNPIAPGLAETLGAKPSHVEQTAMASGDSPILLLNEAANRIGAGEIGIAAVVGGEALRTAAHRAAARAKTDVSAQNASRLMSSKSAPDFRGRYGLVAPVDVYPLYENAGRAAYGQSLAEAQRETGEIWSRFSQVADENPGGWIHKPRTPDEVMTPSADNRPIAHPYTKLMVANSSVNQGAGFIVASLAEARRRGVAEDRLIYVGMGAAAHEVHDPLSRDRYDRSPSMGVSIEKTLELNGLATGDLDFVELYSCFPCVPKMARRVFGWPVEKPATVFGGLTFGGGPIGNYMSHAVVGMVLKLRENGRYGLLFANGGFATHNHTIVLGKQPVAAASFPQDFDYQAVADAAREPVPPTVEDYEGPATIETYTVLYERDGSARWGVIVARTADGRRTLAKVPAADAAGIGFLTDGAAEPVGTDGTIVRDADGDQIWRRG
ncbi:MAG: acetyl-CoA acetyltransferase [Novosphingobium sp.]|nr:acetyl-CoA acetyltransferase [Novosphingobium sp.]